MVTISSHQHPSLQRPVRVGRVGNGLAELAWVTASLALTAAMVGLVVDGVYAGARSTDVTSGALILPRWRSTLAPFPTASPNRWASTAGAVHPNRATSRCRAPLGDGTRHGVSGEVLTLLRSPR